MSTDRCIAFSTQLAISIISWIVGSLFSGQKLWTIAIVKAGLLAYNLVTRMLNIDALGFRQLAFLHFLFTILDAGNLGPNFIILCKI